jgi:hypothetical protein
MVGRVLTKSTIRVARNVVGGIVLLYLGLLLYAVLNPPNPRPFIAYLWKRIEITARAVSPIQASPAPRQGVPLTAQGSQRTPRDQSPGGDPTHRIAQRGQTETQAGKDVIMTAAKDVATPAPSASGDTTR